MYVCRWDFCPHTFASSAALAAHVCEHVAREQPVYVPPSARHLGPDGLWTVDDSWSLSMTVDSTGPSVPSTSTATAPGPGPGSGSAAPDLSSSGISGASVSSGDAIAGMSGMSGMSGLGMPGIGISLGQGLGQANLGAALTGSGYGLGAAFFAPLAFDDGGMPPPPAPECEQHDNMFADFLRSPSPRRASGHGLGPAQIQTLSQASLHFSQQMQSTPADAGHGASQSSAAAVSPPADGGPQTQWG